jgi:hypothetical protein
MEEQMLELPVKCIDQNTSEQVRVIKGVSERLNYFIPSKMNAFYDLRYNFPLNFFNGVSACLKLNQRKNGVIVDDRDHRQGHRRRIKLFNEALKN